MIFGGTRRLGLRSQLDTSYSSGGGNNNATSPATGSNNNDCESTSSGNSSASNSSSGAGCSTLTLKSRKIPPGGATCTASNTLRPISLIGDRAFFNKVYGFGKVISRYPLASFWLVVKSHREDLMVSPSSGLCGHVKYVNGRVVNYSEKLSCQTVGLLSTKRGDFSLSAAPFVGPLADQSDY